MLTREAEERLLGHGLPAVPPDEVPEAVEMMDGKASGRPVASFPPSKPMIPLPARPVKNESEAPAPKPNAGP